MNIIKIYYNLQYLLNSLDENNWDIRRFIGKVQFQTLNLQETVLNTKSKSFESALFSLFLNFGPLLPVNWWEWNQLDDSHNVR